MRSASKSALPHLLIVTSPTNWQKALHLGRIRYAANYLPLPLPIEDWQICSRYDYKTVKQSDPHYLIVPRSVAPEVCRNVANTVPSDIPPLLH